MFTTLLVDVNAMLLNYAKLFGNLAMNCVGSQSCFAAFSWSDSDEKVQQDFFFIFADMIWHCFCLSVFFEDMVKQTKAKTFQAYLDSCHRRYSCVHCRAHLANHDDLISKVRVTLCDFCGTFTARIMMLFALDSHVCLFSVISRQPRTRLPVQFCVSIPSGK